MLTLLSPAGLWALAALGLPLALHLWQRPPRTVRLGSLRYLERLTRQRPRDLRWRERLLLAVRLLLLALLALMLTRPHWRPPSLDRAQHWALLDPNAAPAGESLARLRALQAAGYETRSLASGFPKWTDARVSDAAASRTAPDLWSLLREANAGLPAGSTLAVFTPGRLASLRGDRPALARCQVEWVITPDRASAGQAEAPARNAAAIPITVLILHDAGRTEDARYLNAAVRAVGRVSGRQIVLTEKSVAEPGAMDIRADWVFWLANEALPQTAAPAANLVTAAAGDSSGSADTDPGWIVPQAGVPGEVALTNPVRLWRRVPAPTNPDEAVLWTDGFGRPLLTQAREGPQRRWRFYSRFHPDWTDLVRTTAWPAWLRAQLLPETNAPIFADPAHDLRRADPNQWPTATPRPGATDVTLPLRRDTPGLQGWCWLLAALLFGLERLLSHRRPPAAAPATNPHATETRQEVAP